MCGLSASAWAGTCRPRWSSVGTSPYTDWYAGVPVGIRGRGALSLICGFASSGGASYETEDAGGVDERASRRGFAVGESPVAHEPVDVACADPEDARGRRHVRPAVQGLVCVQAGAGDAVGVVGADERDAPGRMVQGERQVVDVAEAAMQEVREFGGTVEHGHGHDGHTGAYASARHADLRDGRGCV